MELRISSSDFELTEELHKYAHRKLAELTKQVPRKLRTGAHCQFYFAQTLHGKAKFNTCTVTLQLDGTELTAEETTSHMYAALDIAVVHVEQQLRDFQRRRAAELRRLRRAHRAQTP